MLTFGDHSYQVQTLSAGDRAYYDLILLEWTREHENPLATFMAKLGGMSREDKEIAVKGFLASPGWNQPTEVQLRRMACSPKGVIFLATQCLLPTPAWEAIASHVHEGNCKALYVQLVNPPPPSDEEIIALNVKLKEQLCPQSPSASTAPASPA